MHFSFRRIWLATAGLFVCIFIASLAVMAVRYYRMNHGLATEGGRLYALFLIFFNLKILLIYLLVATGFAAMLLPAVRLLGRLCPRCKPIWLYLAVIGGNLAILLFLALHTAQNNTKILLGGSNKLYHWLQDHLPFWVWEWLGGRGFTITTVAALTLVMGYYAWHLWQRRSRLVALLYTKGRAQAIVIVALLLLLAGLGYGVAGGFSRLASTATPEGKNLPNILLLASDSLRSDYLSCNGYPRNTTPNIDELAKGGVNFQNCFVPTASTLESLVSLFTSQYPHTHGLRHMFPGKQQVQQVQNAATWLPKVLAQHGYRTCVIGNWAATDCHLLDMGFTVKHLPSSHQADTHNMYAFITEFVCQHHLVISLFFQRLGRFLLPETNTVTMYASGEQITAKTLEEMEQEPSQPFFIFTFYATTHLPYGGNSHLNDKFCAPGYRGRNRNHLEFPVDDLIQGNVVFDYTPDEIAHIRNLYATNVYEFDRYVGEIVDHLRKSGRLADTIVVIASDHGDDLFEPGCTLGHGISFKGGDQNNRIPLVMHLPANRCTPRNVTNIVRSIDLAPTLLSVLGIAMTPSFGWEGVSLMPYLEGGGQDLGLAFYGESSYLFYAGKADQDEEGNQPLFYPAIADTLYADPNFNSRLVLKDRFQDIVVHTKDRCLRTERFKLTYTPGQCRHPVTPEKPCPHAGRCDPIYRLYDLAQDPQQLHNVWKQPAYRPIGQELSQALWAWIDNHQERRWQEKE